MSALVSEIQNFTITYEPSSKILRIKWQGLVSEEELKTGYEAALYILQSYTVNRILIDTSKRRLYPETDPKELFGNIFNAALRLIKDTIFLAMVVPHEEYFLTSVTNRFEHLKHADNHFVIAEQFLTRAEAEAWLEKAR